MLVSCGMDRKVRMEYLLMYRSTDKRTARGQIPVRQRRSRESITSVVLSTHTRANRPLGFDDVVRLCDGQVTRDQVRSASASLCRDGDLRRVRTAVYQWAQATLAPPRADDGSEPKQLELPLASVTGRRSAQEPPNNVVDLFGRLFPRGLTMTADNVADFQRWAELTQRLSTQSRAS